VSEQSIPIHNPVFLKRVPMRKMDFQLWTFGLEGVGKTLVNWGDHLEKRKKAQV